MRGCKTPDVKFIMESGAVEIRTFCTCRRGEVWQIPYDGLSALSGRSDGPPTGFSNFGLLPRFAVGMAAAGARILDHFEQAAADKSLALWQPLPDFLGRKNGGEPATLAQRPWHPRENFRRGDIASALHPELTAILRGAIEALVARHPDMLSPETICLFPAIEGVGCYPATDLDLKVPRETIWCCGDVVGRFRGLVPALVSGEYAARAAADYVADDATDGLEAIVAAAPAWATEAPAAP